MRDDIGEFLGTLAGTVRQLFSQKPDYLVQLMDVRRIIEVEVVGRLCEENATISHEVDEAVLNMRRAAIDNDPSGFDNHDAAFHLGLVHSVNNEILNVFYDNLFGLIVEVIRVASRVPLKTLDEAYDEHDEIYRFIKARDAAGAKAAMKKQIEGSAGYLQRALVKDSGRKGQEG